MNKFLFLSVFCAVLISSSSFASFPFLNTNDMDYWYAEEGTIKISNELILCDSTSNRYTQITVHRVSGLPRWGTIMHCNQTIDTVQYLSSFINKPFSENSFSFSHIDGETIKVFSPNDLEIKIMDLLTGQIVYSDSLSTKMSTSSFMTADLNTIQSSNPRVGKDIRISLVTHPIDPDNTGTIINHGSYNIPQGIYFLFISDMFSREVVYMQTVRRGI